ncbi:dihydrolipoamide acetyltransferase family protein [Rhizobium puerariae]|uniref:Dihydrolipoamide acetyltransferase component of pyruvate dehydrogenase complex n=1 Tax=Rhizobium puerariae TaxID=1585791 RepID=A0ABV6AQD5_9HYPH
MGQYHFRLPDIGEGVAEAEVVVWHVKVGDHVKEDQSLVDVMTDKTTVDMTSPVEGVITALHGEVGGMLKVGSVMIELEVEGEGNVRPGAVATPLVQAADTPAPALPEIKIAAPSAPPTEAKKPVTHVQRPNADPFAAPATRRRAHELGIPLQFVKGTGHGGRILPDDLDAYLAADHSVAQTGAIMVRREGVSDTKIIGLRRKIAEKMQDAKRRIPHITYVEEVDVTELEALRQNLNANRVEGQPKLTLLPFFIRALVRTLPDFPQINARYDDDAGVLHSHEGVHVGIATQTPGGLMVPVVRHAEAMNIWECASELGRVSSAAKAGTASRDELSGSTITITSLGTLGGIVSTPVINHPEVAILGPNKIAERPILQGNFVSIRKVMNLSSAFDHRIVDGYDAALFINAIKRLLEHPALIFMDPVA